MSEATTNVFAVLNQKSEKKTQQVQSQLHVETQRPEESKSSQQSEIPDSSWTTARTRRTTTHQWGTSRPEQSGSESPRVRNPDTPKKKVIRFTKDELLQIRKPTRILPNMREMTDIVSIRPLDPVCFTPMDQDEIFRLLNSDRQKEGGRGRGRGRGRPDGENRGDWQNRTEDGTGKPSPLWDSGPAGSFEFDDETDLDVFASAALKFQSQTMSLNLPLEHNPVAEADEALNHFLSAEQRKSQGQGQGTGSDLSWAQGDSGLDFGGLGGRGNQSKRNLLLETLHGSAFASFDPLKDSLPLSEPIDFSSLHSALYSPFSSSPAPVPSLSPVSLPSELLQLPPDQWFYTDPQQNVQGPFSTEIMRSWQNDGYLSQNLPLKMSHWASFHPLGVVFADSVPFLGLVPEPRVSPFHQQQLLEEQRQRELVLLQQRQFEQDQLRQQMLIQQQQERERLERERLELERLEKERLQRERAEKEALERQRQEEERLRLIEQQKQQELERQRLEALEQQRKKEAELQRQQQQALVEQQKQEALLEQQRKVLEEQKQKEREREALMEQQRQQLKQQQIQHQQALEQAQKAAEEAAAQAERDRKKATPAPWASKPSSEPSRRSLADIQSEEAAAESRRRQERASQAAKEQREGVWGTNVHSTVPSSSLLSIQEEEASRRKEDRSLPSPPSPAPPAPVPGSTPTGPMSVQLKSLLGMGTPSPPPPSPLKTVPSWSQNSASSAPTPAPVKTLREIMEQEQSQTQVPTSEAPTRPSGPAVGSWAAKALANAPPPPPQPKPTNTVPSAPAPSSSIRILPRPETRPETSKQTVPPPTTATPTLAPKSYGGMSPDLAQWCQSQLRKLNAGNDDLTLIQFCLTLGSSAEIREVISANLGSTPQVVQFASEFIRRKDGAPTPQLQSKVAPSASTAPKKVKKTGK